MRGSIDPLLEQPMGFMIGYLSVAVLELIVFLSIFELVTRYNCWQEIKRGNLAASLATGGKIFGISHIIYITAKEFAIYDFLMWSCLGVGLLFVAYIMFQFMASVFQVDKEIAAGNVAVGFMAMTISVSISYLIGACIG